MAPAAPPLPPTPWTVAPDDPPDTELIAEYLGGFEPMRQGRYYGSTDLEIRYPQVKRDPTLRLRRFHNVILLPHHVMLSQADGQVLPVSFALQRHESWLRPGHWNPSAAQNYAYVDLKHPPRVVDEPVFLAEAGYGAYGHVLLEAVPKLAMLGEAPAGIKVITSTHPFEALFAHFGVDRSRVTQFRGPLFCSTVYIPDPPVDTTGNLHLIARAAFVRLARLAKAATIEPKRRIFLSRSRIAARKLTNESEIEALFKARGFEIVYPELLPIADQIKLAVEAQMIAGPGGTAMHNLLFSPPETRAMVLCSSHWFVNLDRFVSKADGQFAYVVGEPDRSARHQREWSWSIDPKLVEQALAEHFGL